MDNDRAVRAEDIAIYPEEWRKLLRPHIEHAARSLAKAIDDDIMNSILLAQEINDMTKIGSNRIKMSDGSIRTFKNKKARDDFEKVAKAVKHGFKPKRKTTKRARKRKK